VRSYRLIGYENRAVADHDFKNDAVDGGEIGAGHSVTALYEVELVPGSHLGPLARIAVRGQRPRSSGAFETEATISRDELKPSLEQASTELRFAAAVGGAADILRGNAAASDFTLARARSLAAGATAGRPEREEFVALLGRALELTRRPVAGL
jgi:Ca-activated chloride channel family protein